MAGATVVVVPIVIVFLILQRRFIEGIATTGIK
jgi:multiple sugar transport system permease protein